MDLVKSGALIAAARKEKELTQKELGAKLGVSDKAVSNWERGLRFPDIVLLEELSEVLDLSVLELLRGERMEKDTVQTDEMAQTIKEALKAQKKELNRKWVKITAICVLCAVMLCLGLRYAFFFDQVMLINLRNFPHMWVRIGVSLVLGGFFRYVVGNKKTFYGVALGALVLWFACETVSAVIFQQDIVSLVALGSTASGCGWSLLWGMVGAWLMHGIAWLRRKSKKNASA